MTGKQLKIMRIMKDIKAKDIAEQLNVTKQYISILEREVQKIPKHIYDQWLEILK